MMRKLSELKLAVIGLGYVGLPLAVEFGRQRSVIGFDINQKRIDELKACRDHTLSHNVRVYTQSAIADYDFSLDDLPQKYGSVTFGDYCWVGTNVFVNPGVTIGENAVVGANSVVTKDVPPFEIWGGVPARFIRRKKIA